MTHTTFLAEEDARFDKKFLKRSKQFLPKEGKNDAWYCMQPESIKAFLHASHQRSLERLREEVKKICDASTNLIDLEEGPTRALYEKDVLALLSTNQ